MQKEPSPNPASEGDWCHTLDWVKAEITSQTAVPAAYPVPASRLAAFHFPENGYDLNTRRLIAAGFHNSMMSQTKPPNWPIEAIYPWADLFFHADENGLPSTDNLIFSPDHDHRVANTALARKLYEISEDLPPPNRLPVDPLNRKRLRGPMEQFSEIEWQDRFYPYGVADVQNFAVNAERHAEMIDGANVLEFGVGDGVKTSMIVEQLGAFGALAHGFYLNDNIPANVHAAQHCVAQAYHAAADRLGRPDNHGINGVCDDLFNPGAKLRTTLTELYQAKQSTTVWWSGASINSRTFPVLTRLFTMWAEAFKPGTRFVISVDCTTDPPTLNGAYNNPYFKRLFTTALVLPCGGIGVAIDLSRLHSDVEIGEPNAQGIVAVRGKFTSDQPFALPGSHTFIWPGHTSYIGPINKFPFEPAQDCIHAGGMELIAETTYEDPRYPRLNLKQLVLTQRNRKSYACG